ncbi:MAG: ethanolamine utilization protein EutH [Porticoccus sp.]|nr:ethanolamine utilization protein EutH [Porticoccus sp.]
MSPFQRLQPVAKCPAVSKTNIALFDLAMILGNLVPIVIVAGLIAVGLWLKPDAMIRRFEVFGKGVIAVYVTRNMNVTEESEVNAKEEIA